MLAEWILPLLTLTAMEIVLGIDNIIFLAVVTEKLPAAQRPVARRVGLLLALFMRIGLVCLISWLMRLDQPLFYLSDLGLPASWFKALEHGQEIKAVSAKDIILILGGLFLIAKSVHEIHAKVEHDPIQTRPKAPHGFTAVLVQVVLLDLIFSLDSVIVAVGMVPDIRVMITAIVISIGVMLLFANPISEFVGRHPTLSMLALSFLILIGVSLVAAGIGTHINKGYIYFAMVFSLMVEALNLRIRRKMPSEAGVGTIS